MNNDNHLLGEIFLAIDSGGEDSANASSSNDDSGRYRALGMAGDIVRALKFGSISAGMRCKDKE